MALDNPSEWISILSQSLNLPSLSIFLIIALGYSLLYIFFYSSKEHWLKLDSIDKVMLSTFSGLSVYLCFFAVAFVFWGSVDLLSNVSLTLDVLQNTANWLSLTCLFMIWIKYLGLNKKELAFKKIISGFDSFFVFVFWYSIGIFIITLWMYRTAFNFLANSLLFYSLIGFGITYVTQVFIETSITKKLSRKKLFNKFIFASFVSRNITFKLSKKLAIVIASLIILFLAIYINFSFPQINYSSEKILSYNVNGKYYNIYALQQYPSYVSVFAQATQNVSISRSGTFGWVPVDITNFYDYNISTGTNSFYVNYIYNNTWYNWLNQNSTSGIISNFTIDGINKKILFRLGPNSDQLTRTILQLNGPVAINESNVKFVPGQASVSVDRAIFYTNITNSFDQGVSLENFYLYSYSQSPDTAKFVNCTNLNIDGQGIEFSNNQSFVFNKVCSGSTCRTNVDELAITPWIISQNGLFLQNIWLPANSSTLLAVQVSC